MNHEKFRDVRPVGREGGIGSLNHEKFRDQVAEVSMHISEPQSRTCPMSAAL